MTHFYYRLLLQRMPVCSEIKRFKKDSLFSNKPYKHYAKYYILYKRVKKMKPRYVLELGSGISTLIIGYALKENGKGTLISMEENSEYGKKVMSIIGDTYPVEMNIEGTVQDVYKGIKGDRYKKIPQKEYNLIFIDGPRTQDIDLDAFYILEYRPKAEVLIDNRKKTFDAFKSRFNSRFNKIINIGYINI